MLNATLSADREVNQLFPDGVKIQGDVKMRCQLHDCDDFRGFDLQSGELATVPKRFHIGFL